MPTIVIDNFQGRLTRFNDGDINSGYAKYSSTFGNNPFITPGNLTWFENPLSFGGSTVTDLIMAARPRLESGITYVYAIGHLGRLYKIQVNDPTTFEPNLDNPVLLTTLAINSPTFKYGSSIQFFGATEKIYIGHDKGVTSVNFDGTGEVFVGVLGSYTQNVPRASVNFLGKLEFTNGTNLVEIDSTATVTTYTKLTPAFPVGTQARDIDVSPDGNYVQIVVSRIPPTDLTVSTQDTSSLSSADSYFIYWNGTDAGYTSYNPYNSYSLNANTSFGPYSYTMGYDLGGAAVYSGGNKTISLPNSLSPNFSGVFSTGNLLGFVTPEQDSGFLKGTVMAYGQYDEEIPKGLFRLLRFSANDTETDVIQMPVCVIVSNLFYGSSSTGYPNNLVGSAKIYFSTLETSSAPTTDYKIYRFNIVPTGLNAVMFGVYETQTQLFSKKIKVNKVRVYGESWVASNAFTIALIGSDGTPIANSSKTFTAGSNLTVGDDFAWYDPDMEPTYAIGLRITNAGIVNHLITKVEIDWSEAGI